MGNIGDQLCFHALVLEAVFYSCIQSLSNMVDIICHLFLFTTVPCCLLLALLLDRLPLGPLSRGLDFLGRRSLEIYLLNVSFFSAPAESLFRCVLLFAANIALAAALHRLTAALTPSKEEH